MDRDKTPPEDWEPTKTSAEVPSRPTAVPPPTIGQYRIVGKLGAGGMGVVYEAQQEHPKRRVALKVVRGGQFVDEHHLRMFQREADTLARLKHPNIAAIYESGCTEDGQHFFAMELVQGQRLDDYLRKRPKKMMPQELEHRLGLFRKIASAVHYAHQRGVIHRDLKPSNVIVTDEESGELSASTLSGVRLPEIKILDFGLARITEGDIAAATMTTEVGVIKGTLPYMSPEQARGNPEDIDLRTDIYALGVILYEMLTGRRPYDVLKKSLAEAVRVICEESPRSLGAAITGVRRIDPDVETIVGKALEKEADRRYASAAALAEDIERYLASQPILARPPSTIYQLRKFTRRNKVLVGGVAAVFAALAVGAVVSTWQAVRATRAEAEAKNEAATAEQVSEFLVGLFEVSDPNQARGNEITAREILDQGAEKIKRELQDQPLVRARLLNTIGQVYFSLKLQDQAGPHLKEALEIRRSHLGDDHLAVAESLMALGLECFGTSDYEAALAHFREALRIREGNLRPHHAAIAESLTAIARTLSITGQVDELPAILGRVLDINEEVLGPDNPGERSRLAWIAYQGIPFQGARSLLERDVAIREHALGPDHPSVSASVEALGKYLADSGDFEAGRRLIERALASMQQAYGDQHPKTNEARSVLADTLMQMGDFEGALPLFQRYLAYAEETYGPDNRVTGEALMRLGIFFNAKGDLAEGIFYLERAVPILEKTGGHRMVLAHALSRLGFALFQSGEAERARPLLERAVTLNEAIYGPSHASTEESLARLASVLLMSGDPLGAIPLLERCVTIRRVLYGPDHPMVQQGVTALADALMLTGDQEGARLMYRDAIAKLEAVVASDDKSLAQPLIGLGRVCLLGENRDKGRRLFERGVSILEKSLGENHPEARYQRACFHALLGERAEALRALRGALDSGLPMPKERMTGDPDLNSLHGDPEFETIVAEVKKRVGEK